MGEAKRTANGNAIWLGVGLVAAELIGIAGLVMVLGAGDGNVVAQIAVCAALIIVPILFGIALRSELKARRARPK